MLLDSGALARTANQPGSGVGGVVWTVWGGGGGGGIDVYVLKLTPVLE